MNAFIENINNQCNKRTPSLSPNPTCKSLPDSIPTHQGHPPPRHSEWEGEGKRKNGITPKDRIFCVVFSVGEGWGVPFKEAQPDFWIEKAPSVYFAMMIVNFDSIAPN